MDFCLLLQEFLQDVFQSDKKNVVKSKGCGDKSAQRDFMTRVASLPMPNKSLISGQERKNLNGDMNNHQSTLDVENLGKKHVPGEPGDRKCGNPKRVQENAFDFDDDFPSESLEALSEFENSPPSTLATPPDAEVARLSNSRLGSHLQDKMCGEINVNTGNDIQKFTIKQNDLQIKKPSEVTAKKGISDISNITSKENDFRSKLLQTLKGKKSVHSALGNCTSESSITLGLGDWRPTSDTCGDSRRIYSRPPVKRLGSDACDDSGAGSCGPPVKRLITQSLSGGREGIGIHEGSTTLPLPVPSPGGVQRHYPSGNQLQIHTG